MKHTIAILIFMLGTACYSQSAKKMLAEIENKWQPDENGNPTFTRIIELPKLSKEEIFKRAINYYT